MGSPVTAAIVVDSAAALPAELVERLGIHVVPMNVIIDGTSRRDRELSTDELLRRLDDSDVTTSGPSPGEWAAEMEKALAAADEAVVLTVSSEMSTTYRSAQLGAKLVTGNVHVIDTRSAAGGEGLITLEAAKHASAGATAEDIVTAISTLIGQMHLVATLDNLDRLVQSGRVPGIANTAVHTLRVNPMFEFRNGRARALHPAVGRRAAEHRIIQSCLASRPHDGHPPTLRAATLHAAVLEAACPDRARSLLRSLHTEVPDAEVYVASFGSVMLAHVGRGVVGLAWWWAPPTERAA